MLKKLIKYEFRATRRIFWPMYVMLLIFAVINNLFLAVNRNYVDILTNAVYSTVFGISVVVYIGLLVGVSILTLVVIIRRFYKNLLTDEGYLMFTLPASPYQHLNCKLITAVIWSIISAAVSYISIYIMSWNSITFNVFYPYWNIVQSLKKTFGIVYTYDAWILVILGVLVVIFGICVSILAIYAAISVGHLSGDHKKLTAIGAFIGFGIIQQFVLSIGIIYGTEIYQNLDFNFAGVRTNVVSMQCFILGLLAYELIFCVAYYIIIGQILKKRLNLE